MNKYKPEYTTSSASNQNQIGSSRRTRSKSTEIEKKAQYAGVHNLKDGETVYAYNQKEKAYQQGIIIARTNAGCCRIQWIGTPFRKQTASPTTPTSTDDKKTDDTKTDAEKITQTISDDTIDHDNDTRNLPGDPEPQISLDVDVKTIIPLRLLMKKNKNRPVSWKNCPQLRRTPQQQYQKAFRDTRGVWLKRLIVRNPLLYQRYMNALERPTQEKKDSDNTQRNDKDEGGNKSDDDKTSENKSDDDKANENNETEKTASSTDDDTNASQSPESSNCVVRTTSTTRVMDNIDTWVEAATFLGWEDLMQVEFIHSKAYFACRRHEFRLWGALFKRLTPHLFVKLGGESAYASVKQWKKYCLNAHKKIKQNVVPEINMDLPSWNSLDGVHPVRSFSFWGTRPFPKDPMWSNPHILLLRTKKQWYLDQLFAHIAMQQFVYRSNHYLEQFYEWLTDHLERLVLMSNSRIAVYRMIHHPDFKFIQYLHLNQDELDTKLRGDCKANYLSKIDIIPAKVVDAMERLIATCESSDFSRKRKPIVVLPNSPPPTEITDDIKCNQSTRKRKPIVVLPNSPPPTEITDDIKCNQSTSNSDGQSSHKSSCNMM